ncbi:LexA family transcriptional regulator [Candidatus Enterococcus myersii]|uniref:LexA family transcriptional regulator n=1 Tax=Candidatus Enterococcus myersii TaxID=2815322 RepID=UPI001F5E5E81|nr:XRE family transcriptional regulator [Enterococcus sp. MJM12]
MNIEDNLKEIIEVKFGNVKTFAEKIDLPYTTVRSILQRGVMNAKVENVIKIADGLNMKAEDLMSLDNTQSIFTIYNQLDQKRQAKVYNFAEYQLREQNKRPKITIEIRGYVSAGTGEWLEDEIVDEVSYEGMIPEHDFAVKVNGDSMLPLFEDGQVIFIKGTSDVRDGQIIVCRVNNEAFVKKLSGNKLVSLNKKYEDISISDTDDFKIYGVVVL